MTHHLLSVYGTCQFLRLYLSRFFSSFHSIQNSIFLMPFCRMNSSSKERDREEEEEGEKERMTVWPVQCCSLYIHVMAIGRWGIDGTTYTREEEHTCKESVRFLFTAVGLFANDINWSDDCCYYCPTFVMDVQSSPPPFFYHIHYKD